MPHPTSHVMVQWTILWPSPQWWFIHPLFSNDQYTLVLKKWMQGGKQSPCTKTFMTRQWTGCTMNCCRLANGPALCIVAGKNDGQINHKMDHLACFIGGLLAMGTYTDPIGVDSPCTRMICAWPRLWCTHVIKMYACMNSSIFEYIQFHLGTGFDVGCNALH